MHIIGTYTIRNILDEIVAIPQGSATESFNGIISLNPVGQFLFACLREEQTEETLVQALTDNYEVDRETAAADVREFLDTLRQSDLLAE